MITLFPVQSADRPFSSEQLDASANESAENEEEEGEHEIMADEESFRDEQDDDELEKPSCKRPKLSENEAEFESASSFSQQAEAELNPKVFESATAAIVNNIISRAALEASRYNSI